MPRSILKGPSPLLVSRQVASTSGVGRAHGPPPPSFPLAARELQPERLGRGHAPHLSPVRSSATQAFLDTVKQGPGGEGRPLQQEPSGGRTQDKASSPLEPGAGSGTQLGAQRAGWALQRVAGWGWASWVTGPAPPGKDWRPAGKRLDLEREQLPHSLL